jgi:hypothetical protein
MDPNANLNEQLELAERIAARRGIESDDDAADAARLAELVLALDDWIVQGGFLPGRWPRIPKLPEPNNQASHR